MNTSGPAVYTCSVCRQSYEQGDRCLCPTREERENAALRARVAELDERLQQVGERARHYKDRATRTEAELAAVKRERDKLKTDLGELAQAAHGHCRSYGFSNPRSRLVRALAAVGRDVSQPSFKVPSRGDALAECGEGKL